MMRAGAGAGSGVGAARGREFTPEASSGDVLAPPEPLEAVVAGEGKLSVTPAGGLTTALPLGNPAVARLASGEAEPSAGATRGEPEAEAVEGTPEAGAETDEVEGALKPARGADSRRAGIGGIWESGSPVAKREEAVWLVGTVAGRG